MTEKISVITVTLNAAATLEKTILSVINQSYPNIEYLIIDGNSIDGTKEIIKKYQKRLAYYISEKDKGIYDAMNKGINASTGNWIFFIGADDSFYDDNTIEKIFKVTNITNYDFVYGNVIFKSNSNIIGNERNYKQLIDRNIIHQCIFYKKEIFNKLNGYNLKYRILSDYDLNLRIFQDVSFKKKYIPEVVTIFNDKGLSNITIDKSFFEDQLKQLLKKENLGKRHPLLQQYYFYFGFAFIFKNEWLKGLKNVFYSLISGKRKFYFFLITIKFLLSWMGIGKKIKVV